MRMLHEHARWGGSNMMNNMCYEDKMDLQICPSSVKITSVNNVSTENTCKYEQWVEQSELYQMTRKTRILS